MEDFKRKILAEIDNGNRQTLEVGQFWAFQFNEFQFRYS